MNESVLRPLILALHKTTSLLAFRRFVHFPSSFVSVVAILLLSELTTNSISLISWAVYSRFRLAFRIRNLIYVGEYVNPMIFYDNLLAQGKTSLIHLLYACGYLQCYRLIQWRIQTLWRIEGARRATQSLRKHIYHNAWFNIVCFYFVEKASTEQSSKSFFLCFYWCTRIQSQLLKFSAINLYLLCTHLHAHWLRSVCAVPKTTSKDGQTELTWIHTKPNP